MDLPDRRFDQAHQVMFLVAEVLLVVEAETVLAVSELLVKKGTILGESTTLEEEKRVVLSSNTLLVTWCS